MRRLNVLALITAILFATVAAAQSSPKPKIRAITGFVRLDRADYESQIHDTLKILHQAKTTFEQSGYEVQSVRITTQRPQIFPGL